MKTKQQGFSMLEVLITILIVSFGLLALAGLQMYGIKSNRTSYYRSIATMQADDLIERMRANRAYILKSTANAKQYENVPTTQPSCANSTCTAEQQAKTDAFIWNSVNKEVLPGGGATVTYDATSGLYDITLKWKDNPEDDDLKSFSTKAKP